MARIAPIKYFGIYAKDVDKNPDIYTLRREIFSKFLARYGITKMITTSSCLSRLGNRGRGRCNTNCLFCGSGCWQDHRNLWANDEELIVYTSQPYSVSSPFDDPLAKELIEANNFNVEFFKDSFYYPGQSKLIVVSRIVLPDGTGGLKPLGREEKI